MFSNERPWTMILGAFSARVSGEMFLIFQVSLVTAASRPPPLSLSLSLFLSLPPFLLPLSFLGRNVGGDPRVGLN